LITSQWQIVRKQFFFLLLIGNIFFFILFAYFLPIRFEENDDVVMLLFASGKYSGNPEPHLVFINYIYGLFLKFLYSIIPGIEWYTIIFSLIHILFLSVISWSILTNKKINYLYKYIFLLLFYVIEVRLILLFQFTTTAAICALTGSFLIFYEKNFQRIFGMLLILVAGLIRFEATLLVLLVLSPIFISTVFVEKKIILSKPFIFLMSSLILLSLFKFVDYQSYNLNTNWRYYYQYNKLRGQINDNPNVGEMKNNLPSKVSTVDLNLLLNFFADGKVLGLNKLELLTIKLKQVPLKNKLTNVFQSLRYYYRVLILIIGSCIILGFNCRNKVKRDTLMFTVLTFCFALSYVSLEGNLKGRVFVSAILPLVFVMYSCTENIRSPILNKIFLMFIGIFKNNRNQGIRK
jgi:hypothetical protein